MKRDTHDVARQMAKVIQQILTLNDWRLADFKPVEPPPAITGFIHQADIRELQGLLVEVLAAVDDRKNS